MRGIRLAVLALVMSGCNLGPTAVLYGFVVDGVTGQRLDFFAEKGLKNVADDASSKNQVYTVVDGIYERATPCDPGDATTQNEIDTTGCYRLEGVPVGESFPVFAQRPGYHVFEGVVEVPTDSLFANIRMFPLGSVVNHEVVVDYLGAPIAKATVNCQFQPDDNAFQVAGDFITPKVSTTSPVLSGTTDGEGMVPIPGSSLVAGATYRCEAFRREVYNGNLLSGESIFMAGVSSPHVPIRAVSESVDALAMYSVRSNADDSQDLLGAGATLSITFNRPVELVPGLADCMTATLSEPDSNGNGSVGQLQANVVNNGISEQVTASLSSSGLTLTLAYKTPGTAMDTDDKGTSIRFDGIYVRPAGGGDDANGVRVIGSATGCSADDAPPLRDAPSLINLRVGGNQENVLRLF